MSGVSLLQRGESEKMIEEFMLAANRAVAERLASGPALYRHHPPPTENRRSALALYFSANGCPGWDADKPNPRDWLLSVIEHARQCGQENVVKKMILTNSAQRTFYSSALADHFNLAFSHYTHFTSPIRRYAGRR